MKILSQSLLTTLGTLLLADGAIAQVPSTNDTSDKYFNTGSGTNALFSVAPNGYPCTYSTSGACNTASGYESLYSNTGGFLNTAVGVMALYENTSANSNTAFGHQALYSDMYEYANYNTAIGVHALYGNNGVENTATGFNALVSNTIGTVNTAIGDSALGNNTTGIENIAMGYAALNNNVVGKDNIAAGYGALEGDVADFNTALGTSSLHVNRAGPGNTASGYDALASNTHGHYNIADGYRAGFNLTIGSYNIDIGNVGVAAESGVIRIGTSGQQTEAFISGIESKKVTGAAVYVTSSGQLGVLASSERFKTAITSMGSDTAKLAELRPVSFKLKNDASGTRQFGLIAEEVAKVYPELVIRDAAGRISGVRYDELSPMLLNQTQKKANEIQNLKEQQSRIEQQMILLIALNQKLEQALEGLRAPKRSLAPAP